MGECMTAQREDDLIHRYFKVTAEPYDDLEWDGETLQVWCEGEVVERYTRADLCAIVDGFGNL